MQLLSSGLLSALLLAAAWSDMRSHRIPNALVLSGALAAVLLNAILPEASGILDSLAGAGVGLALLLPLYLLRAMGAGDVKLMAMVGAFLGPRDVTGAVLCTFVAGGLLALVVAWQRGVLRKVLSNIRMMLFMGATRVSMGSLPVMEDAPESGGKLPFGVAIAVGTMAYVAAMHWGWRI